MPRNDWWHLAWTADGGGVYFHPDDAGNGQNDGYTIDRDGDVEPVIGMEGQTTLQAVGEGGRTLIVGSTVGGR